MLLSMQTGTIEADDLGRHVLKAKEWLSRFPSTDEEFFHWDVPALNIIELVYRLGGLTAPKRSDVRLECGEHSKHSTVMPGENNGPRHNLGMIMTSRLP